MGTFWWANIPHGSNDQISTTKSMLDKGHGLLELTYDFSPVKRARRWTQISGFSRTFAAGENFGGAGGLMILNLGGGDGDISRPIFRTKLFRQD